MTNPMPVSTGFDTMGSRVITRVRLMYTNGKNRFTRMGRFSSGLFHLKHEIIY